MVRGRVVSAGVMLVRRRGPRAIGCCVWPVVRPAAGDMLYRVFSGVFQSDALAVVVVCRVVDWRRKKWRDCLIR